MAAFVRLLRQKWYPPLPETASFAGRTILVTGATTGLGLEAAKKLACLKPKALIITARSKDRGVKAKEAIQSYVKTTSAGELPEIHLLLLNMSQFEHVVDFANNITAEFPLLDTVILNAGTASNGCKESPSGWEEQIQVNCLSTTLLALLLLPKLLARAADDPSYIPHMEIVTSGLARLQTAKSLAEYLKAEDPLPQLSSTALAASANSISGSQKLYGRSKMLMEINMKHLASLPSVTAENAMPQVIINSACPGVCYTDLGREMGTNFMMRVFIAVFFGLFGRTAEQGSNTLVSALTRDVGGHGKMWKDDKYNDGGEFLESAEGKAFGDRVWHETCKVLQPYVSNLATMIRGLA